ncbi:MAG: CpaF family protein [Firmicutes bacterium HGW-Firmicutes-16]|nr:MAG: CpaF family protein [Firmicutes bacterium HGW-Firmicutes-16]
MSITAYEYLSILQTTDSNGDPKTHNFDYLALLEKIRATIAERHSKELAAALDSRAAAKTLKALILQYCVEFLAGTGFEQETLVEKIYLDMAGLGLLTEYLQDESVEEINLNGYDTVEIIYPDRTKFLYGTEAFPTPTAALDIVKRMVRMGGMILDAQAPKVDSYIGDGTRISAMIPPAVPPERGVVVSIRKQSCSSISRVQLIESGSVSSDMLDFLTLCLCNGISVGLAGGTGSGKTTDQAFLLNEYIKSNDDYNNRVYIIEDSRELTLIGFDHLHERPARVIYTTTKPAPNPITMRDHIINALRYHPKLIVPAEVRDGAAYEAASAGQTGHTILTAFHADNAEEAYARLVSMCHFANTGLSDERLLEMCVGAWPIMVYKKQLKDNSRKYMEVFEATGVKNGKLCGTMLYRFVISENERDENGQIVKVRGEHRRVGNISAKLYNRLKDNGVEEKELNRHFPDAVKGGV